MFSIAQRSKSPEIWASRTSRSIPGRRATRTTQPILSIVVIFARQTCIRGFATVLDGSNADDLDDYRPGLAAARELGVRSPLQEADLTKEEIRSLSRRAGLPTWDMPASPCLASRIPYGIEVTPHRLHQIEVAEARLRELASWGPFRVRHHGEWARLELCPDDLRRFSDNPQLRSRVTRVLKESGFARACVDLEGYRRGALNEALAPRGVSR